MVDACPPELPLFTCSAVADGFVGRQREVHDVCACLTSLTGAHATTARLVTLTGLPGSGKTEVALRACWWMRERRQYDIIAFAELALAARAGEPLRTVVGRALGLASGTAGGGPFASDEALADAARVALFGSGRRALLVLDGCDVALARAPELYSLGAPASGGAGAEEAGRDGDLLSLVSRLRRRCPHLRLLVTSCHELPGVGEAGGGRVLRVGPLPAADCAALFARRSPRPLDPTELRGTVAAFAKHPVVAALQGHCGAACLAAKRLSLNGPRGELRAREQEFVDTIVPALLARFAADAAKRLAAVTARPMPLPPPPPPRAGRSASSSSSSDPGPPPAAARGRAVSLDAAAEPAPPEEDRGRWRGAASRAEARAELATGPDGAFVVRRSGKLPNCYVLDVRVRSSSYCSLLIEPSPGGGFALQRSAAAGLGGGTFPTLDALADDFAASVALGGREEQR